ncbi:TIGR01244 family sulfur transferase [Yoonia sp. 208BN28-4]|uniref:TIGR01244 family sulfur transferase n=1 Tax=Yoonia sp. 208BN28-4 TaxID=3126505 RepID=UPI0030A38914
MEIRQITPDYAVSPQIDPEDMEAIAQAGFTTVICNRPDAENPPSHHASVMEEAARNAGLQFVVLPVTHMSLTLDIVASQRSALDNSEGPVLAYCASGTRSSIVWSLGQAGDMAPDDIIAATAKCGYDLRGLHGQIEQIAASKG